MIKIITIGVTAVLLSFSGEAQTVQNWSFTSVHCQLKDSTLAKKRLIDTTFTQVAVWNCNGLTRTITMNLTGFDFAKTWTYDSMKIKANPANGAEVGQYYYLHQSREQDVKLIIYYPRLSKIIEIGVEKGKQIRAKYEAK